MNIRKDKLVLVLLSAVVIAAGCIDGGDSTEGLQSNPVTISDFSPSQSVIPADTSLRLNVEVENTGNSDAEDVAARISGPTFASSSDQEGSWRTGSGEAMVQTKDRTFSIRDVRAPGDASDSVSSTESITLTTPSYGEGREPTDNFDLELFYSYETQADTQLRIMSEEEYLNTDVTPTVPEVNNDPGPIQVEMLETVPKIQYDEAGDDTDELCLQIRNEGPGTPFNHDKAHEPDTEEIYNLESDFEDEVNVSVSNVGDIEFEPGVGEAGWNVDENGVEDEGATIQVELINDEERACFQWSSGEIMHQDDQTANLDITASYGYLAEDSTSVTVEGR